MLFSSSSNIISSDSLIMGYIPFGEQYFVEKDRNNKYEWIAFAVSLIILISHGIMFRWLPHLLRSRRSESSLNYRSFFKFLKAWNTLNSCWTIKLPFIRNTVYFQPSIILILAIFLGINGVLCLLQTKDLNYEPRYYVVSKRISKVAMGNMVILMLMIVKNDLVSAITGLSHDRVTFLHIWLGRYIWLMITIHFSLACKYWLGLKFIIMIEIPPQIFGMIAYGSLFVLTWGSLRFLRNLSYDFFLTQHRIFAFIMLLLAFFHNAGNRAAVIIAVHCVVIDRIVSKIIAFIHKRRSPAKGLCGFEIIDDNTILVTISIKMQKYSNSTWYAMFLPKIGYWKPGQHIYLNVPKVNFFQYHPFTIASLPNSETMTLIIRKRKGFTKRLMKILETKGDTYRNEELGLIQLKGGFHGPYGATFHSLLPFDRCVFLAAGSGASFTIPVALDLLNQINARDENKDFLHRTRNPSIHITWCMKQKRHLMWIKHLFPDLIQFVKQGKLTIDLHITANEGKIDFDSNIELNKPYQQDKIKDMSIDESLTTSDTSSSIFELFDIPGVQTFYERPDISSTIHQISTQLTNDKALAVLSCGPPMFSNEVKLSCQKARKINQSPEIYCYCEAF